MSIAVTGASGALGRRTAELVLARVDPREVVLTTRHPGSLTDLAARGAQVRRADFTDPAGLTAAFTGVERLLLVSTDAVGARLAGHLAAIAAAADAGVSRVVYTSVPEPVAANPALVAADHAATEQALRESGMAWTSLRNNLYSHMQVPAVVGAAATGRLVTNWGSGAAAFVTRDDCAAVAACTLVQDGHENVVYDVTGPDAVTAEQFAALATELGGRDVELVQVDDDACAAGLEAAGLPGAVAQLVTSFGAATRGGFLSTVTSAVADLTGSAPTRFADVVRTAPAPARP